MITIDGYSKDTSIMPEGIVVTWGKDLVIEKGGLLSFVRHFETVMKDEDTLWLQKCKNQPKHDIAYVYIIVCGQVRYRLFYAGWEPGGATVIHESWSSSKVVSWPRIICAGPFTKAPFKIYKPGFQGFRYCTKLF